MITAKEARDRAKLAELCTTHILIIDSQLGVHADAGWRGPYRYAMPAGKGQADIAETLARLYSGRGFVATVDTKSQACTLVLDLPKEL